MAEQTFPVPALRVKVGDNASAGYPLPQGASEIGWTIDLTDYTGSDTVGFGMDFLVGGVWQSGMAAGYVGGTTMGGGTNPDTGQPIPVATIGPTRTGTTSIPTGATRVRGTITVSRTGTIGGTITTS